MTSLPENITETIEGIIERVTYHNADSGFCVLKVKVKGSNKPKTKDDLTVLIGNSVNVSAGEWVTAEGAWHYDKKFGHQFKSTTLQLNPPTTLGGIEKYLASGLIKGIGPVYAKTLVQTFKEDVLNVIEDNPKKLSQVPGLGPKRIAKIVSGWSEQKIIRNIMVFLHSYGVSTTRAARIYKTYGDKAVAVIQDNPYKLAQDIHGIGFLSADSIAEKLGIEKSSLVRARAGISYVLLEALGEGHCGLPTEKLIEEGEKLLDIEAVVLEEALNQELKKKSIIQDTRDGQEFVFLAGLYHSEKTIADRLLKMSKQKVPWPRIDKEKAVLNVQKKNEIVLSASQKKALLQALKSKLLVITGGPGVGKTTLLKSLLHIFEKSQVNFKLAAPTGRAAKRMFEATGFEAKTVHRLLEVNGRGGGGYNKNEGNLLETELLVIDEASMLDVPLFHALLKALPPHAGLFLVGDQDQLPSVGPGQVLSDIINSSMVPCVHLKEVFRQGKQSEIVAAAYAINTGIMPDLKSLKTSDFFFLPVDEPEDAMPLITNLVKERLPKKMGYSAKTDIQILSPMARGFVGTRTLNMELQKTLNPPHEGSLQKFGNAYSVGDKVMQTSNNYDKDVYNGDIGIIEKIDEKEGDVIINFDGMPVTYEVSELDEITLAYALTIHKSQGSEYPVVIIPVFMTHYNMLQRNLIYTGVTRGKKLVIIVGQKKALHIAIKRGDARNRWTLLEQWLKGEGADLALAG